MHFDAHHVATSQNSTVRNSASWSIADRCDVLVNPMKLELRVQLQKTKRRGNICATSKKKHAVTYLDHGVRATPDATRHGPMHSGRTPRQVWDRIAIMMSRNLCSILG
eukprot:SAG31_NODE_34_length_31842_cov_31.677850_3_plen_108_part_00